MNAGEIYARLQAAYGQPGWWSDDPYVVMVQAILVQNTNWATVKRVTGATPQLALPGYVSSLRAEELEALIRPCGFCRGKAAAIHRLTAWYEAQGCDAARVRARGQRELRDELLALKGIGAETADVILVYAFYKPAFIIDAYTRRFLERLGFCFCADEARRAFFAAGLAADARLYGRYHRLLLEHGIRHCRKLPLCTGCAFAELCGFRAANRA